LIMAACCRLLPLQRLRRDGHHLPPQWNSHGWMDERDGPTEGESRKTPLSAAAAAAAVADHRCAEPARSPANSDREPLSRGRAVHGYRCLPPLMAFQLCEAKRQQHCDSRCLLAGRCACGCRRRCRVLCQSVCVPGSSAFSPAAAARARIAFYLFIPGRAVSADNEVISGRQPQAICAGGIPPPPLASLSLVFVLWR
jgi:hypothetical protein